MNQTMAPMTSATNAPRDCVSSIASISTPQAGKASARSSIPLERLAPSHIAGITPMAAIEPMAFQ